MESNNAVWQANKQERAGITDAAMHPVLKLAPMRRRFPKFVSDEFVREGLAESEGILFTGYLLGNGAALLASGIVAPLSQIVELL